MVLPLCRHSQPLEQKPQAALVPSQNSPAHTAVVAAIRNEGGWLDFSRYLDIVLNDPHCGYYGSGRVRFGPGGDFDTASTISPLFGETIATQISQVLEKTGGGILELGAGNGDLAKQISCVLNDTPYHILETSASLRLRQEQKLQGLPMHWLDTLPKTFNGVIIANEVLDSVPFRLFAKRNGELLERGVTLQNDTLCFSEKPPTDAIVKRLSELLYELPDDYETEINPRSEALVSTLAETLNNGLLLIADYGFGWREYYHPQRGGGTMMCHSRHIADTDSLVAVGNKDITAHVDFSAIAEAGLAGGADFGGYTTQANFLINCGITEKLAKRQGDSVQYIKLTAGVQKLLALQEMGELFKFIAFTKGEKMPLIGFKDGDKSERL